MSVAQEAYLPSTASTTGRSAMDLSNFINTGQPYEPYQELPEDLQPHLPIPQLQLPPRTLTGDPPAITTLHDGRIYSLIIIQQPARARMCGFGDKDRRPISPPPCIRLIVRDAETKEEIDINDIDTSYFVLSVDLWSADLSKEVNLVRHSSHSPSISMATAASYPPNAPTVGAYTQAQAHTQGAPYNDVYQQAHLLPQHYQPAGTAAVPQSLFASAYGPGTFPKQSELVHYQQAYRQQEMQQQSSHHHHLPISSPPESLSVAQTMSPQVRTYLLPNAYGPPIEATQTTFYSAPGQGPLSTPTKLPPSSDPRAQPGGMFTRNLIGSLCVSAFKLTDPDNKFGVWFVLQDLSVRTEGTFRLKLNFVNVGLPSSDSNTPSPPTFSADFSQVSVEGGEGSSKESSAGGMGRLNTGSAPVLASCFSDPFEVFSAKRFPGVIESTKLSKCFATQGIKIPIRKDAGRGNERGRADEDDE